VGLEPTRANAHYALNVACLPFHHFGTICQFYNTLTIGSVRHQGYVPGSLDSYGKGTLMARTITTDSPWQYFSPFGDEFLQSVGILIINIIDFVGAKAASLSSSGGRI
jgi:hypothetical protein